LRFASDDLKADRDVVSVAISRHEGALKFAAADLRAELSKSAGIG